MTKIKLDSLAPCYVPCSDDVPKYRSGDAALLAKEVTFPDLTPSNSDGSMHSGAKNPNRLSSDSDQLSARSSDQYSDSSYSHSATSDEYHRQHKQTIPNKDTNCDECSECRELKEVQEDNSESAYLQGCRCDYHSQLMKTTAILTNNAKNGNSGEGIKPAENCSNDSVSSPTHSPLSNYKRARTPSGGSVIKQIQIAIEREEEEVKQACKSCGCQWQNYVVMFALLLANLLNYMDRYTIAGVLLQVQDYYDISNADAGLLQTSFIVFYMIFSPIFGYLGDRWNRKRLMAFGILFWSVITLAGSFVPKDKFVLFLFMRAMVGIGEASYSTIAPTIIADLFVKDKRTIALAFFYFAIPVGSGFGYIVGSNVAKALGAWQWALRVTPGLGFVCVLLILLVVREPTRGHAEGGTHLHSTSWTQDLCYLVKNKSFMFSSGGFTCVAFVAGALALWAPAYIDYSIRVQGNVMAESRVALYFGIITCVAGILGVFFGSETARWLRRKNPRADALVCAFGLIVCAPFLFLVIFVAKYNTTATWVLIFLGETFLCLNWAIVTDILLYTVIPTRRSTAEAVQILMSHAFGDAGSPYIIGAVSDSMKLSNNTAVQSFISLQYSLYMTCFVAVIGGGFFLATAMFVQEDRAKADKIIKHAIDSESKASRAKEAINEEPNGEAIPEQNNVVAV